MPIYEQLRLELQWNHAETVKKLGLSDQEIAELARVVEVVYQTTIHELDRLFGAFLDRIRARDAIHRDLEGTDPVLLVEHRVRAPVGEECAQRVAPLEESRARDVEAERVTARLLSESGFSFEAPEMRDVAVLGVHDLAGEAERALGLGHVEVELDRK